MAEAAGAGPMKIKARITPPAEVVDVEVEYPHFRKDDYGHDHGNVDVYSFVLSPDEQYSITVTENWGRDEGTEYKLIASKPYSYVSDINYLTGSGEYASSRDEFMEKLRDVENWLYRTQEKWQQYTRRGRRVQVSSATWGFQTGCGTRRPRSGAK
jgi:hypothetical protein